MSFTKPAFAIVVSTLFFAALGNVPAQQIPNAPSGADNSDMLIQVEPFPVLVTLQSDGSLAVNPAWATYPGNLPFDQMEVPPNIRTTSHDGWLLGEFALQDGSWFPLFSVPVAEADVTSVSKENLSSQIPPPDALQEAIGKTQADSSSLVAVNSDQITDVLAIGTSDPAFPSKISAAFLQEVASRPLPPGARRFFVNNASGDDSSEGKMLHPQSGKLSAKGPKRTLAAVLQQIRSGDEIVLIGTGEAYSGNFVIPNVTDITITPIGDVTINP